MLVILLKESDPRSIGGYPFMPNNRKARLVRWKKKLYAGALTVAHQPQPDMYYDAGAHTDMTYNEIELSLYIAEQYSLETLEVRRMEAPCQQ